MEPSTLWTLISVGLVSLIGLVGLATLAFAGLRRHNLILALVALAAGTLLGDAFLHLLPEAVEIWGAFELMISVLILAGFLGFYLLEAFLRMGHAHAEHASGLHEGEAGVKPFGILNLIGDGLHNFLDGILIATAYLVDFTTGVATTIAVGIHELPQEFGDFAVLIEAGFRPVKALLFNLLSAVVAFAGAAFVLVLPDNSGAIEQYALPVIVGGFLYIACADLIPELHHHAGPRHAPVILMFLLLGVAIMAGLAALEGA